VAAVEEHTLALTKDLGQPLLAGAFPLAALPAPASPAAWGCGRAAPYERRWGADVLPVLGLIEGARPVDWRRSCGRTGAAFAAPTGLGPGSSSAGLDGLLALLGARGDAGDAAVDVLARLTVGRGCGYLARTATERLGRVLRAVPATGSTRGAVTDALT
jgi:hypothetical protein